MRAQAAFSSLRQMTIIGGPALGGVLVAISTPLALGVAALGMIASAGFLRALFIEQPVHREPPHLRDALEGLRYIRSQPVVLAAISLDLFAVLFGGATALLPAFADGIFHAGPQGHGAPPRSEPRWSRGRSRAGPCNGTSAGCCWSPSPGSGSRRLHSGSRATSRCRLRCWL
jgi:hypothetical protein